MLASALFACGTAVTNTGVSGGSAGGGLGGPIPFWVFATYGGLVLALGIGLVAFALVVPFLFRQTAAPARVPAGATLSPDGLYWWDGSAWRPAIR